MPAGGSAGCVATCTACAHRALSAYESEQQKTEWVARWLSPFGQISPLRGVEAPGRWHYRDKVTLRAEYLRHESRWKFGVRRRREGFASKEFELVDISMCPVQTARVNEILRLCSAGLSPDLPLCFISIAGSLVTLVLKGREVPASVTEMLKEATCELVSAGVTGVYANLNPSAGNRVFFSRGWRHLWGEKTARMAERDPVLGGLEYGPSSFQQPIAGLYSEAIRQASGFLSPKRGNSILDLYSGIGATLRVWSLAGARTIGVELNGEAAAMAEVNAPRAKCLRGRAEERIPQLQQWRSERPRGRVTAFLNPPRAGLEKATLDWLAKECRPVRIAYLSCNAKTQSRDLSVLIASGYAVRRITPYDFFPQTIHVESLAEVELDSATCIPGPDPSRFGSGINGR